jgi:hypothetical protein
LKLPGNPECEYQVEVGFTTSVRLGLAEVRAYQAHLVSRGVSWDGFNQAVCALRFFYGVSGCSPCCVVIGEQKSPVIGHAPMCQDASGVCFQNLLKAFDPFLMVEAEAPV